MIMMAPTADPELNGVLRELVTSLQAILRDHFLAAYLHGSFALGDWDVHSDVDFLVAVDPEVSQTELTALQTMHARIYDLDSHWARHLEGSCFPRETLRHDDPSSAPLLYLDNTSRELVRSNHDNTRVVRWTTREFGIALAGPDPRLLIDPVPADQLRQEVSATMRDWARQLFADPSQMDNRWYQPFAVLSYCRMLHTLHTGRVGSKPAGARWAMNALDRCWADLIERAWQERPNPSLKVRQKADPNDLKRTLDFIQYALTVYLHDSVL
jgi:predicted nucleotidyltransferase